MDEVLERLKNEVEDERRRLYLEKFGAVPQPKIREKPLSEFN